MKFDERSYSGKLFRPSPILHIEKDASLIIVATPWGHRSGAKKVVENIVDLYLSSQSDGEATSALDKMTSLSQAANNLRSCVQLANKVLYQEDNKAEYESGLEIFVGTILGGEFSFIQIGQPQVFLLRESYPIAPLATNVDLSVSLSPPGKMLAPIPATLMGLEPQVNLSVHSYGIQDGDRIALLSRSFATSRFLSMDSSDANLDSMTDELVKQDQHMPFWLGVVDTTS
ncbi:MAG: hypothetical protein HRT45_02580 [Bdellovibrionales bacterium]|nr:hypothetical protein [Bdellovibrionales bacterium]